MFLIGRKLARLSKIEYAIEAGCDEADEYR
jgi:hypothetical protein